MVPGSPIAAVLCFGKDRVVLSSSDVSTFAARLNALEHVPVNTPICLALGPSYMLFFTYASGAVQRVEVPTICAKTNNGKLWAQQTPLLLDWLRDTLKQA